MWPIKTCLFFFGFIGACTLSVVYPLVGIINYMMVYLVNPNSMWWGRPLEPLGIRYSMAAAVCLILGMIVSVGRVPTSKVFFGDWMLLLILFVVIVMASGWASPELSSYSAVLSDKMVKMTIFLFCFVRMGSTRRNLKAILCTLVIGSLVIGYDAFMAPADDFIRGRLNFVGGADFRESSGLAAHMAAMLPLIAVVAFIQRHWLWRVTAVVAGVLTVNTIVQCRTRSAFVGLLCGGVVALLMAPRGVRVKVYAALIVASIGAYNLTDEGFRNRMLTVFNSAGYEDDAAIQARVELWDISGQMFVDHPFGVGVGRFSEALQDYRSLRKSYEQYSLGHRVTHNSYLLCATELGVQGTLVFALIVSLSFFKLYQSRSLVKSLEDSRDAKLLVYGTLLSVVIYLVSAAFTDRLYTESFWWVLALPVCLEQALLNEVYAGNPLPELADGYPLVGEASLVSETFFLEESQLDGQADAEDSLECPVWAPAPVAIRNTTSQWRRDASCGSGLGASSSGQSATSAERNDRGQFRLPGERAEACGESPSGGLDSMSALPVASGVTAPVTTLSGLKLLDYERGIGRSSLTASRVTIDYIGYLTDGTVIDRGNAVQVDLATVMEGLAEGIRTMREAGRRRIIIPWTCERPLDADVDSSVIIDVTLLTVDA